MPPRAPAPTSEGVTTAAKVAFLGSPAAYRDHPSRVEIIETHLSWVFLTDLHAFKMKKPVRGAFFDFASVEGRRRNAMAEVTLNRRLAATSYRGIVPLGLTADGRLALRDDGTIVDWLVQMARLPAAGMLDHRLAERRWHPSQIRRLGDHLAGFYAHASPVTIRPPAFFAHARRECADSAAAFGRTRQFDLTAPAAAIARRLVAFLDAHRTLFLARLRARRMVEGHGDLRPEHISLGSRIEIIDCLEFCRSLRIVDPVDELAFLGMECARQGAPEIGRILLERYRRRTGDAPAPELIAFYVAYRALIRARLAIAHLEDHPAAEAAKWRARAAAYLAIASRCLPVLRRLRPRPLP
jgi:aminoglycoside phosphotransferase family enzyme